ncbi:MAG TPA: hypothetical protein DEA89_03850 [Candidatus Moranbacteria bacterium]|nr:hypothetical protein [Candidatus Moranbacteria bacterium]HBI50319.1 hypothetical protein [Candidatus Moranbacteria bacterium]HBU11022.1 hypothetical protein [Candidatus Moranbacteria bacterium]HCO99041.1 hypothetical protein [Candidatus Moranbacteria bacterium]
MINVHKNTYFSKRRSIMYYLKMLIDDHPGICVFISFSILAWIILFSIFCRRDKQQDQQDSLAIAQQDDFE